MALGCSVHLRKNESMQSKSGPQKVVLQSELSILFLHRGLVMYLSRDHRATVPGTGLSRAPFSNLRGSCLLGASAVTEDPLSLMGLSGL